MKPRARIAIVGDREVIDKIDPMKLSEAYGAAITTSSSRNTRYSTADKCIVIYNNGIDNNGKHAAEDYGAPDAKDPGRGFTAEKQPHLLVELMSLDNTLKEVIAEVKKTKEAKSSKEQPMKEASQITKKP